MTTNKNAAGRGAKPIKPLMTAWANFFGDIFGPQLQKPKPVIVVLLSGECRFRFAFNSWLVFEDIEQAYQYLQTARDNSNAPVSKIR